jgi:predicted metal-dependent HD superfamily phosphohydrolase
MDSATVRLVLASAVGQLAEKPSGRSLDYHDSFSDESGAGLSSAGPMARDADLDACVMDIGSRYGEPHRFYHTTAHLADLLHQLQLICDEIQGPHGLGSAFCDHGKVAVHQLACTQPHAVLAALFHDIVYLTTPAPATAVAGCGLSSVATSNELQSADIAVRWLRCLGIASHDCDVVRTYITSTERHEMPRHGGVGAIQEEALGAFLDADLSILATPSQAEYQRYATAVRKEYSHLSDEQWRQGRIRVLERLLKRCDVEFAGCSDLDIPCLFFSRYAQEHGWAAQAKRNMAIELVRLQQGYC